MSGFGRLAALDEYDPGPMAERVAAYRDSPIGATQGRYREAPKDFWKKYDVEQVERDITPDPHMNPFASSPQQIGRIASVQDWSPEAAEFAIPHDVPSALIQTGLGAGLISRGLPPQVQFPARVAATVLGGLGAAMGPAEAAPRDPRLWSAISKTKLRKPLDEMEHRYTDVRTPVPTFVNPEDLIGSYGILTPWDLSAANKTLTHVDAQKLDRPVRLYGGTGFPEANPGMAAASEQSISRRLDNQAARLMEETGKPVTIWPMTMTPQAIDASHHVADPLSQLVQTAKITKKDANAFDDMMRESVPNWVGIKDNKFQDYISGLKGGMTTKALMADRMALAEWQAKGFPDVAAVRHAASEPALIEAPRNTTGMAISRYIPGQGLLNTTHPSYPKGVAGQYIGQLASLVPFEDAAPSIAKGIAELNARNMAAGKKVKITPRHHLEKPTEGVPTEQFFDETWARNIRRRWGDIK